MEKSIKPDKKYFIKVIWILLTISIVSILLIGIIHLIIDLNQGEPQAVFIIWLVGILCLLFMWLIATPIAFLWIKNLAYTVYGDRISIYKGIIKKTQQNIPYRAVTDFALERTLFDRILNLGSIKIQTAGQSPSPTGYEGKLAGLVEYEAWHTDLREHIKSLHPVAESITTKESTPRSDTELLSQILVELKEIKKNLVK